jgi:hypothetical protein
VSANATLTPTRTAASVGMAPAGSKVTLDPATFMLSNKRLIGCTEGDSVPYEVGVIEGQRDDSSLADQAFTHQLLPQSIDHSSPTDIRSSSYQS